MNKNIEWIKKQWVAFGPMVAISSTLNKVYKYGPHTNNVAYAINKWKHKCIEKALCKKYGYVIERYSAKADALQSQPSKYGNTIWTIWWQGEENAPEAMKMCYQSMRKFSSGHEVIVISESNYSEYITLPDFVLEKVKDGKINFIHLADIIRMHLMYYHGGLWLDATLFLLEEMPNEIFEYSYFTGKLPRTKMACVSEGRWNGTFFGGHPGNPFFEFMINFYYEYWKHEEQVIDYFLIDYMTDIAYQKIPSFTKQLDAVPVNNEKIFQMNNYLNSAFDSDIYNEIVSTTGFHKLQRRNSYRMTTDDGELTFYGYLVKIIYGD